MKKYLFSALAICLAAGAVAFTAPKSAPLVYFTYQLSTAAAIDVQDTDNWIETPESDCAGSNQACQIRLDQADLTGTINTGRVLSAAAPSLVLSSVDANSDGKFTPLHDAGPAAQPFNKP